MSTKPGYTKTPLSSQDLVSLLQQRGLQVRDHDRAAHYIQYVGYFRLSMYFIPYYERGQKKFRSGVTFDDILNLYIFDRQLRLLTLNPIQRIEIAIRSTLSNHMSLAYGAFWFLDESLFDDASKHSVFLSIATDRATPANKNISQTCKHFFEAYGGSRFPPSWILFEELTIGCWSKLFSNIKSKQDKRAIAGHFGFKAKGFASWLHFLTVLRNALAHHARFWNATFPFAPAKIHKYARECGDISGAYQNFVVITHLLRTFTRQSSWPKQLAEHLNNCPLSIYGHMHFPCAWEKLPFWTQFV